MGYNCNRVDLTLGDVVGSTPEHHDLLEHDDFDWGPDWWYDEPDDRDAYYHGLDLDVDDEEPPIQDVGYDPHEIVLPLIGKVSRDSHARTPTCPFGCCEDKNLRHRRRPKYNSKPKRKDPRATQYDNGPDRPVRRPQYRHARRTVG